MYALLAERAVVKDDVELLFSPNLSETDRKSVGQNRDELDRWLNSPIGVQAEAEKVLLRELGGAA